AVAMFELPHALDLLLFLLSRGADRFHRAGVFVVVAIAVEADDGANAFANLFFIAVGGGLDLAALVAALHGGQHAAEAIDLAELGEDRFFNGALDGLHAGGAAQEVHRVFEEAGFFEKDGLRLGGEADVLFAGRGERFIGAVAVAGIGGVGVGE